MRLLDRMLLREISVPLAVGVLAILQLLVLVQLLQLNEVVFSATPAIVIPAGSGSFCQLEFDITVAGASNDATPGTVEETTGFNASASDGSRVDSQAALRHFPNKKGR